MSPGDTIHAPLLNTATVTASNVTFDPDDTSSATATVTAARSKLRPRNSPSARPAWRAWGSPNQLGSTVALQDGGTIDVAVDLPPGRPFGKPLAAIADAIATLNAEVGPLGIHLTQVSGTAADAAQVHIQFASTSDIGGADQG